MRHMVRAEWSRGIRSWRLWVAVAATIGMLLLSGLQYAQPWYANPTPRSVNFFTVSLMALGAYLLAFWPVLIPIVAALPAGDSLAVDRRRGVDGLAITRVGWTRYLWGKLFGTMLVAVAAMGIAIAAVEAAFAAAFPIALPRFLGWTVNSALPYRVKISGVFAETYPPSFHPHFFWAGPGLYVALVVATALWATAALAGLSTAAAVWVRQPLLTLAIPMILFFSGDVLTQAAWSDRLIPSVYAGAYLWWVPSAGSWAGVGLYWAVVIAAPVLVMGWMILQRREWPRSVG